VVVDQSTLFSILRTSTWQPRSPSARQPRSAGANGDPVHVNAALVNNTSRILVLPTTRMVDSEGTAALFRDGIFRLHGLPSNLVSDRGATFTSEFSRSLCCQLTGITHGFPSANGRPDRARQFSSRAVSAGILQSSAGRPDGQLFVNGFLLPEFLDSEGTAALFWDGIFRLHGLPSSLVSDRGATFMSEFSCSLCCRLTGITHGFPSANGRPDRARQFNWRHASS
jgi:hypothetical protein